MAEKTAKRGSMMLHRKGEEPRVVCSIHQKAYSGKKCPDCVELSRQREIFMDGIRALKEIARERYA